MFDWLLGKNEKDHGYIRPRGFAGQSDKPYQGHVPPRPIPAPRPLESYNPVAMPEPARMGGSSHVPKQEVVQPNISEPVITLLNLLERDEWEPGETLYQPSYPYITENFLTNIYDERIVLCLTEHYDGILKRRVENFPLQKWLTTEEQEILNRAFKKVHETTWDLNIRHKREIERSKFAKLINVEV